MVLSLEQQQAILRAGGGMALDASSYTFNQLLDLAKAAKTIPTRLTLRRIAGLTQDQMLKIALANPGHVLFDFAEPVPIAKQASAPRKASVSRSKTLGAPSRMPEEPND